jgi:23S rRNA (cytidine2498-2'-O)-methyltransferase
MLVTCQSGYEAWLARELADRGLAERERGPAWVAAAEPAGDPAALDSAFAHLLLVAPVEIRRDSVNSLAQAILDGFCESLRGERIDSAWTELWQSPPEVVGLGRRMSAVQTAFAELLGRKLARVAKLSRSALPRTPGPTRGLFVWFADFGRVWFARTAIVNGPRRMADDPAAPSRSFLKVEEAYLLLGREPQAGETVADLGAAPGGWSYSAARRGARVVAIDNGPLKGGALDHPKIEHRRADAFAFVPAPGERFDWLFCDLVEEPHHVLDRLVGPWLRNRWCRSFIVNLKFGRVDPLAFLAELRAPGSPLAAAADLRIRHLYHDREEFTVVGRLP